MLIAIFTGEVSGECYRIGLHDDLIQIGSGIVRTFFVTDLRHHTQVDGGRIGQLIRDVVLEVIFPVVDVGAIVIIRSVQQSGIVVCLQTHIVSHARTTSLYVYVGTLVEITVSENQIIPVNIRIHIRIYSACRVGDLFFRIFRGSNLRRASGLGSFIIGLHIGGSISKFHPVHRTEIRSLQRHINRCLRVFSTALCRYQHYTVSTTVTINSRCRSIFQQRKAFNRLCRNSVQVVRRDFYSIQQDQRSGTSAESIDTTNIKVRSRTRLTAIGNRNDTR